MPNRQARLSEGGIKKDRGCEASKAFQVASHPL